MSRSRVNSCGGISCSRMLWASCFCSSIKWIYQEAKDKSNVKGEILHMHALRYKRRNTRALKLIRNALQEDGSRKILSPLPQHNINSVAVTCLSWEDTWRTKLPSLSDECSAHNIQNLLFGDILVAVVISLLSSPINQHQQVNLKDLSLIKRSQSPNIGWPLSDGCLESPIASFFTPETGLLLNG